MRWNLASTGIAAALLALAAPQAAMAQLDDGGVPVDTGTGGTDPELGSHLRAGAPEGPKPIERKKFDGAVEKLFRGADTNHDGTVTLAEFNAIIGAQINKVIADRFKQIDANNDKLISYAEFAQWQRGIGSAALVDGAAQVKTEGLVAEEIHYNPGRSQLERNLARLVAPLTATAITEANTNYDAGVSLDEFIAWEGKRFTAADTNNDGWVTIPELRLYLQAPRREPGGQK